MLIMTTSCDAGVCVDLSCDACDVLFSPWESTPQIPTAVWAAATARGWQELRAAPLAGHVCPTCAANRRDGRLVEVAPSAK